MKGATGMALNETAHRPAAMRKASETEVSDPGASRSEAEFQRAAFDGCWHDLPMPGQGSTLERWQALRSWGAGDLSSAKLLESHADALAILAEADRPARPGELYAVWASSLGGGLTCRRAGTGVVVTGDLRFASAARWVDRALLVARDELDRVLLLDIDLHESRITPDPDSWKAVGMLATDSVTLRFDDVPVDVECVVETDGWYLSRPGFWIGAIGVAAVWAGAIDGMVGTLREALAREPAPSPHRLAHLGACAAHRHTVDVLLSDAAAIVDRHPLANHQRLATLVRTGVEAAAQDVLTRTHRALGAAPLGHDAEHARRMADLPVYLRQHHAERDLEWLGRATVANETGSP